MNFLALSGLVNATASLFAGLIVFSKNSRNIKNQTFFYLNLSVCVYSIGYLFWQLSDNAEQALFWFKTLTLGIIFINVTYLHFIFAFLDILKDKKIEIRIYYLVNIVFALLSLSSFLFSELEPRYNLGFWPIPNISFHFYLLFWSWQCLYGFYLLLKGLFNTVGLKHEQIKYFLISAIFGFIGGATNWPMWYKIYFPPHFNIFISLYVGIVCYSIVKYRLLDIKLVLSRATIFVSVYTLVLGVPFGIGLKLFGVGLWLLPVSIMAVLATIGPYMYIFLQGRAENRLLAEQKQYQQTLQQASVGMASIKDLNHLLSLIVHILTRSVRIEYCSVYLMDAITESYVLSASRGERVNKNIKEILSNSDLIKYIESQKDTLVVEEFKRKHEYNESSASKELLSILLELNVELIIPLFVNDKVLSLIMLGKKKTGQIYSNDDVMVFSILGNQAALAIENAMFYEESKKDLAQRFHESRLKSLGALGSGIAHQMYNRLNVISLGGSVLLDMLSSINKDSASKEELLKMFEQVQKNVDKMTNSAVRGTEITEAIKNYARTDIATQAISLDKIIKSSESLVRVKHPRFEYEIIEDYKADDYIWANYSTLQDVIYNALDNSCDAMKIKTKKINEGDLLLENYKPIIKIKSEFLGSKIKIEIKDNGVGMTKDELEKVLVPFFTTKGAQKGTGMGMNMAYQLLQSNKGTLEIDSKYNEWTRVLIILPKATKEQIEKS
ncbi:MAG: ATP-binding protein [Candidatus Zapsychrus exili]|nr:ATP-binding protein [Candidatus Zapsychrus exili]